MQKVEYLRALDDNTWDTIVVDVPSNDEDSGNGVNFQQHDTLMIELLDYAEKVLSVQTQHRKVVLWAVYNEHASR
jgi:hypothetical protein